MSDASAVTEDPSFGEDMAKLSPKQQLIYATRMSTDPPLSAVATAQRLGMTSKTVGSHWSTIRERLARDPLRKWKETGSVTTGGREDIDRLRDVPVQTLVKLTEMRAEAIIRGITPEKIADASLKELTAGYRELINSRQLLKGEPTQILQVNQRANLKKLFPVVMKQLQARGVTLEISGDGPRVVKQIDAMAEPEPAV